MERTITLDLHLHTAHSFDCEASVRDVITWAERKKLDVIALTDHDSTSAHREAASYRTSVRIIPGVEVTTSTGTHLLGYFITESIRSTYILDVIDEIHESGGICSLPHPFRSDTGLMYNLRIKRLHTEEEVAEILERVDLLEGLNAKCSEADRTDADEFIAENPDKPLTAGSDGHQPYEVGRARLALHEVSALDDLTLKQALLKNTRDILWESGSPVTGLNDTALGALDGARGALKSAKSLIPQPVWRRMRSLYLRSRGTVAGRKELRQLGENRVSVYRGQNTSERAPGGIA